MQNKYYPLCSSKMIHPLAIFAFVFAVSGEMGGQAIAKEKGATSRKALPSERQVRTQEDSARKEFEQTFNAENIANKTQKKIEPASKFSDQGVKFVKDLTISVTKSEYRKPEERHKNLIAFYNAAPAISDRDYQLNLAAMNVGRDYENRTKPAQVAQYMRSEYNDAMQNFISSNFAWISKFTGGLDFDFDFKNLIPSKKAESKSDVKYGLVLEDVKPATHENTKASLTDEDYDWTMAPKAEPIWTIGPVSNHHETNIETVKVPVFTVDENGQRTMEYLGYLEAKEERELGFGKKMLRLVSDKIVAPSTKFTGKVKPRMGLASAAGGGIRSVPGLETVLSQSQGYYAISYVTKENFVKETIAHAFMLPLFGSMTVQRKFDENMKGVETTLANILIVPGLPSVTLVRNDLAGDFKTSVSHSIGAQSFGFSATTPAKWEARRDFGKKPGERYEQP